MTRPLLTKTISLDDFKNYYWLKEELIAFCRSEGIARSGSKIELTNRIANYLETGKIPSTAKSPKIIEKSFFDWKAAPLSKETRITASYKNTENVRAFFKEAIGAHFKFNIHFMKWMRENVGKTLGDAIEQWDMLQNQEKTKEKKVIAPQFEYNTYIRDCLADQANLTLKDAIRAWNWKKQQKGHNRYEASDILKIL